MTFVAQGARRGLHRAVRAFSRVTAVHSARLVLVGQGARRLAERAGESVSALEDSEALRALETQGPSVLVVPDPFAESALARRAHELGIPILAVDPNRRSRLLRPASPDRLVPPEDETALAHAMLELTRARITPRPPVEKTEAPRPKRVLIFRTALNEGGADRVTITLLEKLDRAKVHPTLVLMRSDGPYLGDVPSDVRVIALDEPSLWTALPALVKAVAEESPDVLFALGGGESILAAAAHELTGRGRRLVVSERNIAWNGGRSARRGFQLALKRALYPRADLVTAVSEGVRDDFVNRLHLDPSCTHVLYNPVVDDRLDELARAPVTHPWFPGARGERPVPVVLGCGRLVRQKGFDVLLSAFSRLSTRRDARLVILGEGPERARLLELGRTLGIGERMALPGFDKNPHRYMARADAFVLSSRNEGLPGALIQAMAAGAPAISTRCPSGPDEIISEPGENGILVPVDDAEALAVALERVLSSSTLAHQLSTAGRLAARRFGVSEAVRAYEAAIAGTS